MTEEKKEYVNHANLIQTVNNLQTDVDRLKNDFTEFKAYTYNKIDEIKNSYEDIKERVIRMETLFGEKFNNLERILTNRDNDKKQIGLTILSQIISPLIVGIVIYIAVKITQ